MLCSRGPRKLRGVPGIHASPTVITAAALRHVNMSTTTSDTTSSTTSMSH